MTGFKRTGMTLSPLPEMSGSQRAAARRFCLDVIREFYGTDYRPDWHADLDSLTRDDPQCWFSSQNRGAFWVVRDTAGDIIATAGVYILRWKPNLVAALADRYPNPETIPQLVRVYVRKDQRGRGIGRWLHDLSEAEAVRLGFATLYLHASASTPATLRFWGRQGFVEFANADGTAHFDKALVS